MMDQIREQLADLKLNLVQGDRNVLHEKVLAQAPCIITDMKTGIIIFASERVNQIFGYIFNELEGKTVADLMPESYRKRHSQHLHNYSKIPTYRNMGEHGQTLKGLKKDGTEFDIKISLEPFIHEQKGYVLATLMSVTNDQRRI